MDFPMSRHLQSDNRYKYEKPVENGLFPPFEWSSKHRLLDIWKLNGMSLICYSILCKLRCVYELSTFQKSFVTYFRERYSMEVSSLLINAMYRVKLDTACVKCL